MPTPSYDAVIIGSGITGGWAAKELTERGLNTLVLEAGRPISPEKDYVEHVPVWEMRFRGHGDRKRQEREQPIQRRCYACDEMASKFFVNDLENPYTTDPDKPFMWIRGRQVGGRSIMWGRQVYRWSDLEMASKFFVNDLENPYTTDPDKPFMWIRGRQVGGRSIMWGRQVYRWSDL